MNFLTDKAYSTHAVSFRIRYTDRISFYWALEKIELLSPFVKLETTFPILEILQDNKVESLLSLLKRAHTETSPYVKVRFEAIAFYGINFSGTLCDHFREIASLQSEIAVIDCDFLCDRESLKNAGGIIAPSANLKKLTLGGQLALKMTEFVDWICLSLESGNAWNVEMLVLSYEKYSEEFMESLGALLSTDGNNIKEFGVSFANRRMASIIVDAFMTSFSRVEHVLILKAGEGLSELEDLVVHETCKITKITAEMDEPSEIMKVMDLSTLKGNSLKVMHIGVVNFQIINALARILNNPNCRLHSLHLSFPDVVDGIDLKLFVPWVLNILPIVSTKIKSLTLLNFPMTEIMSAVQMLGKRGCQIFHLEFYPKRELGLMLKTFLEMRKKQFDPTGSFKEEDSSISYANRFYSGYSNDNEDEDFGSETESDEEEEEDNFYQLAEATLYVQVKTKDQVKSVAQFLSEIRDPSQISAIVFEETPSALIFDCIEAVLNFIRSPYGHVGCLAFHGRGVFTASHMISLSKILKNPRNLLDTLGLPHVDGSGMRVLLDALRNESCLVHFLEYKPAGQYSIHIQEQVTQQLAKNQLKHLYKFKEMIETVQHIEMEKEFTQYVEERKSRKRKVSETDFDDDTDVNNDDDDNAFDLWLDRGKFKLGAKFQRLRPDDVEE